MSNEWEKRTATNDTFKLRRQVNRDIRRVRMEWKGKERKGKKGRHDGVRMKVFAAIPYRRHNVVLTPGITLFTTKLRSDARRWQTKYQQPTASSQQPTIVNKQGYHFMGNVF